ncbi:MAG: hypothetical protein JWM10_912, partial [Myxococcaceae bacterium]|nr:hypothetical protein [Myxococcaceae bacterium]
AVGTSCANGLGCGPGTLVCASSDTCQQGASAGAACSATSPCAQGLSCAGGTCRRPPATAGAACDAELGCQLGAGVYCDPATRMCTAFSLAPAGQMCGVVSGRLVGCSNASCEGAMGLTTPGTCTAYAGDNAPCNTADGPQCQAPAECIPTSGAAGAGTCRIPGAMTCP